MRFYSKQKIWSLFIGFIQSPRPPLQQPTAKFIETWAALIFGMALTILTFWGHLRGGKTFPWDFLGGYHFQSYAWYSHGNFLSPPNWFPWGDMGFPAALAIQSGAWYLPISLLDLLGIPYSIEWATRIQVLHVGFASFGMYLLLRAIGFNYLLAILGMVGLFFSSGFYSNQQHVDIIRGYALIPWLMWSLHPNKLLNSSFGPLVASILLWQFFVASYPGVIVSTAYALSVYSLVNCSQIIERRIVIHYLLACVTVSLIAILLSSLKWVPFFSYLDLYNLSSGDLSGRAPFSSHHLLTLLYPYDVEFLSSDVTMRSLYLPFAILAGVLFVVKGTVRVLHGVLLIFCALFFGAFVSSLTWLSEILPGYRISRFPLSDWRPFLHVGIIILGCEGWKSLFEGDKLSTLRPRFVWAFILFALVAWVAKDIGYNNLVALKPVLWLLFICVFVVGCQKLQQHGFFVIPKKPIVLNSIIFCLIILAAIQGFLFNNDQDRPWEIEWSENISRQLFGVEKISMPSPAPLSVRPERVVVGVGIEEILKFRNHPLYNRCWYEGAYCLFGYNNLRLSIPHKALENSLRSDSGNYELLRFITSPQKLLIFPKDQDITINDKFSNDGEYIRKELGVLVKPVSYASEKIVYQVKTPQEIRVLENEIWWRGWTVKLCDEEGGCRVSYPSTPTSNYLRSWSVPEGDWLVVLEFEPSGVFVSQLLFLFGVLLVSFWSVAKIIKNKRA